MSANFRLKVLAGAIALALGGTAFANTSTDGVATGDLFLNIVDTNNNTSFFFDTGVSQASFSDTGHYSFNVSTDPNYTAFEAGIAANDVVDYSVLSATKTTATPNVGTVFFTSNNSPSAQNGSQVSTAQTTIAVAFLPNINATASTTTNSAHTSGGGSNFWGLGLNEGVLQTQFAILADSAAIDTPLSFYSESSNALRSTSTTATLTQFSNTWDLSSAGVLSYNVVPLPTPLVLLLSGLGLMGVMSRRGKSSSSEFLGNASAV